MHSVCIVTNVVWISWTSNSKQRASATFDSYALLITTIIPPVSQSKSRLPPARITLHESHLRRVIHSPHVPNWPYNMPFPIHPDKHRGRQPIDLVSKSSHQNAAARFRIVLVIVLTLGDLRADFSPRLDISAGQAISECELGADWNGKIAATEQIARFKAVWGRLK